MEEDPSKTSWVRWIFAAIGITAAFLIMVLTDLAPGQPQVSRMAGVAVLVGTLWLTEVLPLAVTALLPLVLLPVLGIAAGEQVAREYAQDVTFVFLGGFIIALAMERWGLHRRIALYIITTFGATPSRLVLGFLVATAVLSMWISNTAAAMMMVTIALAVVQTGEESLGREFGRRVALGLLLAVAYGATIGGIATPVGTPPNLIFIQMFHDRFPEAPPISFLRWMMFALPLSVLLIGGVWSLLTVMILPRETREFVPRQYLYDQYHRLGPTRYPEWVVMGTFCLLVGLWVTRTRLDLGSVHLFGWSSWFDHPRFITDGSISIAIAVLLFLIPAGQKEPGAVMNWETAGRLPWNIVLLFGGGFALAKGFEQSGLSLWLGNQLQYLGALPPWAFLLLMCLGICFVSEFTSNTATTQLLLPILAAISVRIGVHPLVVLVPATITCSWGFMMPVGTPPNAIAFGTNRIRIAEMAGVGLFVNLMAVGLTVVAALAWAPQVFGISSFMLPDWAQ